MTDFEDVNESGTAGPMPGLPTGVSGVVEHVFGGRPLPHKFSEMRQLAAQAMGHRVLSGTVRVEIEEVKDPTTGKMERRARGLYEGELADAAMVLWLCHAGRGDVVKAIRLPDWGIGAAMDWAEKRGMAMGSAALKEARRVHDAILEEIHDARFEVEEVAGGSGGKADGDQPTVA